MEKLAEAGFRDLEFWSWGTKDISILHALKEKYSINFIAICTKFANLVDSTKRAEYKQGLIESIATAKEIGCKTLIGTVGDELPGVERSVQHDAIVETLKEMAPLLEESGITLVVEPLNTRVDHIGYYLWSSDEAFEIIKKVNSPNVKVLFDIYHQQIMEGDLIRRIEANIDHIGHFHAAGNPGRGELSSGEINYTEVLKAIKNAGYKRHVGMEYFVKDNQIEGLNWCRQHFK